jgi:hypothetical protein
MSIDRDELLNAVYCRLYGEDDDTGRDPALTLPAYRLALAKQHARGGDLEPLRKLYPEIAEFIAKPKIKRVRRPFAMLKAIRRTNRRDKADTIRRIREIIQDEIGQTRVDAELVAYIAAKVLKTTPQEIEKTIHRG